MKQSLRAMIAPFFQSALEGPLAEELRAAQRSVVLSRAVVLIWISVFVMPTAILSYVYFMARPEFGRATTIVLAAVCAVIVHRMLIQRGLFERHYHLAMLLLVAGVFGTTRAALVEIPSPNSGDFLFSF